ncbi:hypothetical protein D030_3247B, partial [Vibrio parahaemolyticus AQ3810]
KDWEVRPPRFSQL